MKFNKLKTPEIEKAVGRVLDIDTELSRVIVRLLNVQVKDCEKQAEIQHLEEMIEWIEEYKCQFSERENIIITPENYQSLKDGLKEVKK